MLPLVVAVHTVLLLIMPIPHHRRHPSEGRNQGGDEEGTQQNRHRVPLRRAHGQELELVRNDRARLGHEDEEEDHPEHGHETGDASADGGEDVAQERPVAPEVETAEEDGEGGGADDDPAEDDAGVEQPRHGLETVLEIVGELELRLDRVRELGLVDLLLDQLVEVEATGRGRILAVGAALFDLLGRIRGLVIIVTRAVVTDIDVIKVIKAEGVGDRALKLVELLVNLVAGLVFEILGTILEIVRAVFDIVQEVPTIKGIDTLQNVGPDGGRVDGDQFGGGQERLGGAGHQDERGHDGGGHCQKHADGGDWAEC